MILLVIACGRFITQASPTLDEVAIYTAGAVTSNARATLQAGETAVALLTVISQRSTPISPFTATQPRTSSGTQPPEAPSNTPIPPEATATPLPSPTSVPPTATQPAVPCDLAQFVADITVPPGTNLAAGTAFVKTWRVLNTGSCIWNQDYTLVLASGDALGSLASVPLPAVVAPGQTVDISVTLSAPRLPGGYQGNWLLRDPAGTVFGVGASGTDPLVVRILAVQLALPGPFAYDLAYNYCAAIWQSAAGGLPCPGQAADPNGSVILVNRPALESGRSSELGLWVRPNQARDGWASGQYPAYTIQRNDHFKAEVSCLADSPRCDVTFSLDYRAFDGSSGRLGAWEEVSDRRTTSIDIDLTSLAGRTVQFTLSVSNNGRVGDANAVWLAPRVENLGGASGLALEWQRQVSGGERCSRLEIYLQGSIAAQAVTYTCSAGTRETGRSALTTDEFNQLIGWVLGLHTFDGEVYRAGPSFPVRTKFKLYGIGNLDATDSDIQAINSLATRVYERITGDVIVE